MLLAINNYLTALCQKLVKNDLFANFYYVLGLALQKGMPFIIIPLIVWCFSSQVYTSFVLIYYTVQLVSLIVTLGTPSSVIVFWNGEQRKDIYLGMQLALLVMICLPLLLLINLYPKVIAFLLGKTLDHTPIVNALISLYVIAYVLSNLSVSLLRVTFQAKIYFYSVLVSMTSLILMIVSVGYFDKNVAMLVFVYVASLLIQTGVSFYMGKIGVSFQFTVKQLFKFSAMILRYALPIAVYTVVTTSVITLDKSYVKLVFPSNVFEQYIFNFQFAYIINILSVIVGMYSLPQFCKYLADNDVANLKQYAWKNYLLVLVASLVVAIASYCYAAIVGIHLAFGFWILCGSFAITNLFAINVSLLEAYRSSAGLLVSSLLPVCIFWLLFYAGIHFNHINYIYFSFLIYNVLTAPTNKKSSICFLVSADMLLVTLCNNC